MQEELSKKKMRDLIVKLAAANQTAQDALLYAKEEIESLKSANRELNAECKAIYDTANKRFEDITRIRKRFEDYQFDMKPASLDDLEKAIREAERTL